jgi:CHAT domain-containing protein/Tfp pilus assembly protein PilF
VRVAVNIESRSLSPPLSQAWIDLERRFEEAEEHRLRYEEASSREALRRFQEVASDAAAGGRFPLAAQAERRAGLILETLGELERSSASLAEAFELASKGSDPSLRALTLASLGLSEVLLGRTDEGQRRCEEARSLSLSLSEIRSQAESLYCLAEVSYHRGDFSRSLETHASVLPLARAKGDRWLEARALLNVGYSQSDVSELELANANYLQALDLWERLAEKRFQALTLVALGRVSLRLGENQRAIERFEEGMALMEAMGDDVWKASILFGFGDVAYNLGDYDQAIVHFRDALALYRDSGLRMAVLEALNGLGKVLLAAGRPDEALGRFHEALDLSRELGIAREEALSLRNIGAAHHAAGKIADALSFYELSLAKIPGDAARTRALTLNALGAAQYDLGQSAAAVETFARALELSQASQDQFQEASSLYYLAAAAAAAGNLVAAGAHLERAIELAESLRGRVLSRELRASYLASIHDYYELYVDVLMRASDGSQSLAAEAFQASERARARSLLDSLSESRVDIRQGVDEELVARERRVREIYNAKALREMELIEAGGNKEELDALKLEIATLAAEYDRVQSQIRSKSPGFASLTQAKPAALDEIQRDLLEDDSVLLQYALGKERSFLWSVSKKGVTVATLPGRSELEGRARRLYELLTTRQQQGNESPQQWRRRLLQADLDYSREAKELGGILLGPAGSDLRGKNRLLIAAEGALQYVPFGALPMDDLDTGVGGPLVTRLEIIRAPSASVLVALRKATRGASSRTAEKIAIFADPVFGGDDSRVREPTSMPNGTRTAQVIRPESSSPSTFSMPRLAATRLEAEAIRDVALPRSVLLALGFQATRSRVIGPELRNFDIIHFATHGVLNDERPELSGVVLSLVDERGLPQDGFVRLHDVYNLTLPVDLVVLSACDTALGKLLRGEGLVGLVRGFLYAGAGGVVASLWKVDDQATKELMTHFYESMLRDGLDVSAALRQAQLSLLSSAEFRHPYYWAAFELHGNWR